MLDSNETFAHPAAAKTTPAAAVACRSCGAPLTAAQYYCPECDTPHFPHLKASLASPFLKMFTFFVVIAGPVAAYTLWELLSRVALKL